MIGDSIEQQKVDNYNGWKGNKMNDRTLTFLKPTYTKMGPYELEFNQKNYRKISKKGFERLKKKIMENVYEPIKIWKNGNVVLAGNQRLSIIRHLIENENYQIDKVDVAIYDVDERTAKFIQLADNEHDGTYDFEKMLEDMEEIESLDLQDILDPKIMKKLHAQITTDVQENIEDIKESDFNDVIETESATLTIKNVPKNDLSVFYETINRVKKVTGIKNEWRCLKLILKSAQASEDQDILDWIDY